MNVSSNSPSRSRRVERQTIVQDLRFALRRLVKDRWFSVTAIAALALGIGANTAIFSVVNAVLLRPVPFPDPDRIVFFMTTSPEGANRGASPAKFAKFRRQTEVIQDASAFRTGVVNLTGGGVPEQLRSGQVTADFFRLTGAPIIRGRTFSAEEDLPRGPHVALISEGLWSRRFGADPDIVGKPISLGGDAYTIIGIVGSDYHPEDLGAAPEVYTPFQLDPESTDQGHYFVSAGRLKEGVSLDQARARYAIVAQEFRNEFLGAGFGPNQSFSVEPMRDAFVRDVRTTLVVLLGAVSFVLLIACANVANLLLVRATTRRREIAIRSAIGAGRGQIIRQLLTESVVLAAAGAAVGLSVGTVAIRALLSVNTAGLPRVGENGVQVGLDWRVLVFTMVATLGTGLLIGVIPAFQSSRVDLSATMKESGSRSGTGFRQNKARSFLVILEMALALVLLVGATLFIRTSVALGSVDPGFRADGVLTMRMSLASPQFATANGVEQLVRQGTERLRTIPGVQFASATCCVPLQGGYGLPFVIVGRALPDKNPFHGGGAWVTASAQYFDVFGIPIKHGRVFDDRDDRLSPPVVVISEAMAKQYWQDGDPLKDRLVIGRGVMREFADEPERQIIGVVGDVRNGGLERNPGPVMYIPQAQMTDGANALNVGITPMSWIVRSEVPPGSVSAAVQEQLRQVTGLPVSDVRTMDEVVSRSTSRQRFNMLLMTVFAGSALLLAAIGVYGLMAYSVEQRTQEIGIRLALGAEASAVCRMIVIQGMRLALVGVVAGIAGAFGLTRLLASFLFGVEARDPTVFVAIPVLLTCVALVAVWFPALRASRVDPLQALRYE
jgi:putative ABC transport system permease protein